MSNRSNHSDADGCAKIILDLIMLALAILGLFFVGLSHALEFRPQAYSPVAVDRPVQQRRKNRRFPPLWSLAVVFIIGGLVSYYILDNVSYYDRSFWQLIIICFWIAFVAFQGWLGWLVPKMVKYNESGRPNCSTVYNIHLSRNQKLDFVSSRKLIQTLLQADDRLTLSITATHEAIQWQVIDPGGRRSKQGVIDTIRSRFNEVVVVAAEAGITQWTDDKSPAYRRHFMFGLTQEYIIPLAPHDLQRDDDPLVTLSRSMDLLKTHHDEKISYQLYIITITDEAKRRGLRRLQDEDLNFGVFNSKTRTTIGEKFDGPLYHCFLVVMIESQDKQRVHELSLIANHITNSTWDMGNELRALHGPIVCIQNQEDDMRYSSDQVIADWIANRNKIWRDILLVLYPGEIAALWHLPNEDYAATKITWAGTMLPEEVKEQDEPVSHDRICIGTAVGPGQNGRVYLANEDRAYHLYTTGQTGMGKSTLLHNLIHQDIKNGHCVAVLDPHGKLVDQVLAASIAADRLHDVVLLECGRAEYPVPLNPMRIPPGVSPEAVTTTLYTLWQKIYEGIWLEGQTNRVMRNLIRILLCDPKATPYDIQRVLTNRGYRDLLVEQVIAQQLRSTALFWLSYNSKTPAQQHQMTEPVLNRSEAFLGNRAIERMTCHPNALDFKGMIQNKQIILINLYGDAIATEMANLGVMFLTQLQMAAHSLGYLPEGAPPRCYVYIDEVERFVGSPIDQLCAEARKFGLSLMFANQFFEQLQPKALKGILGNVSTLMTFDCSAEQAKSLRSTYSPEIEPHTLQHLSAYQVAVRTKYQGKTLPAFMVKTLPPPNAEHGIDVEEIRQRSIRRAGLLSAAEVDKWLEARYFSDDDEIEADSGDGLVDIE